MTGEMVDQVIMELAAGAITIHTCLSPGEDISLSSFVDTVIIRILSSCVFLRPSHVDHKRPQNA